MEADSPEAPRGRGPPLGTVYSENIYVPDEETSPPPLGHDSPAVSRHHSLERGVNQPGDIGPVNFRNVLEAELPHHNLAKPSAKPLKSALAKPSLGKASFYENEDDEGLGTGIPRLSVRPSSASWSDPRGDARGGPKPRPSLGRASLGAAIKGNAGTAPAVRLMDAAKKIKKDLGEETELEDRLREVDERVMLTRTSTMFCSGPLEGSDPYHKPQPWWQQITLRSLVVGGILGFAISVVMMNLNLTTGIIPSLNIAAGILGYFILKTWVQALEWMNFSPFPFTPQENTVIQTCVVSCYGLAFAGGFGSYLLAMDESSYRAVGSNIPGNDPAAVVDISLARAIPYMACIGFTGVFLLVQLRKTFIIDYGLQYPSGTATGILISSFHTPKGAIEAQQQVKRLGIWGLASFFWACFKWFFSAGATIINSVEVPCNSFDMFPSLGLKALDHSWNFDFALDYIGAGLICPHEVNFSMLFGAILSWGILWPIIQGKSGNWYPGDLEDHDFRGFTGYKNFIAIAIFMGDGSYNMIKVMALSALSWWARRAAAREAREEEEEHQVVASPRGSLRTTSMRIMPYEDPKETKAAQLKALRNAIFLRDPIPAWFSLLGAAAFGVLGIVIIPFLFRAVKWYYIIISFFFVPFFAMANSYAAGLTDWNMATIYGKIGLFCFAAWAGEEGGGIIAGLAMCGVLLATTNAAADLMQDFRTGYITLSSPRSMFAAQMVGALYGVFIGPLSFYMFKVAFDVGVPGSQYPAPYAAIFRSMAIIGVQGFSGLPSHCTTLMAAFFVGSILLCVLKDFLPPRFAMFVPIPAAAAIAFYVGGNIAIDMVIGSVIKFVWEWRRPQDAELSVPCAASGLICGAGLWAIPAALMAIFKVNPPICMYFGKGVG